MGHRGKNRGQRAKGAEMSAKEAETKMTKIWEHVDKNMTKTK